VSTFYPPKPRGSGLFGGSKQRGNNEQSRHTFLFPMESLSLCPGPTKAGFQAFFAELLRIAKEAEMCGAYRNHGSFHFLPYCQTNKLFQFCGKAGRGPTYFQLSYPKSK